MPKSFKYLCRKLIIYKPKLTLFEATDMINFKQLCQQKIDTFKDLQSFFTQKLTKIKQEIDKLEQFIQQKKSQNDISLLEQLNVEAMEQYLKPKAIYDIKQSINITIKQLSDQIPVYILSYKNSRNKINKKQKQQIKKQQNEELEYQNQQRQKQYKKTDSKQKFDEINLVINCDRNLYEVDNVGYENQFDEYNRNNDEFVQVYMSNSVSTKAQSHQSSQIRQHQNIISQFEQKNQFKPILNSQHLIKNQYYHNNQQKCSFNQLKQVSKQQIIQNQLPSINSNHRTNKFPYLQHISWLFQLFYQFIMQKIYSQYIQQRKNLVSFLQISHQIMETKSLIIYFNYHLKDQITKLSIFNSRIIKFTTKQSQFKNSLNISKKYILWKHYDIINKLIKTFHQQIIIIHESRELIFDPFV